MKNILIGCDPEVFVYSLKTNEFVSAHGMVRGTKEEPQKVPFGAVQVDGMALEFNTIPAHNEEEFVFNVNTVYKRLSEMAGPDFQLRAEPVATFSKAVFAKTPTEAKLLGCDPDFNAWTRQPNQMDPSAMDRPLRTGSGHIHIGWTQNQDPQNMAHFEDCVSIVRQLDYYLGCPSLLWDADNRRRSLYGQAGAFRCKPYGCEYRVLSNTWLRSESLQRWVYRAAIKACEDLSKGHNLASKHGDAAQRIINKNHVEYQDFYKFDTGLVNPPELKAA